MSEQVDGALYRAEVSRLTAKLDRYRAALERIAEVAPASGVSRSLGQPQVVENPGDIAREALNPPAAEPLEVDDPDLRARAIAAGNYREIGTVPRDPRIDRAEDEQRDPERELWELWRLRPAHDGGDVLLRQAGTPAGSTNPDDMSAPDSPGHYEVRCWLGGRLRVLEQHQVFPDPEWTP